MSWRRAIVQDVDHVQLQAEVLCPEDGWTAWCPVAMPWPGCAWLPPAGAQVMVALDEDGQTGVVLGALYSERSPVPPGHAEGRVHLAFQDGSTVDYDPERGLSIAAQGGCEVSALGPCRVTSADQVTISAPEVRLSGTETCRVEASGPIDLVAHGPARIESREQLTLAGPQVHLVAEASVVLEASGITLQGPVQVLGNLDVTGSASVGANLSVVGTTPAHHTHPTSDGATALAVP